MDINWADAGRQREMYEQMPAKSLPNSLKPYSFVSIRSDFVAPLKLRGMTKRLWNQEDLNTTSGAVTF
jgi:hypothetical protein